MGMKELIASLKAERAKGDKADQSVIDGLLDDIEPIAARDWADIKRWKEKAAGKSPEDVTALETKIEDLTLELGTLKSKSEATIKTLTAERDGLKTSLSDTSSKARNFQTDVMLRSALGKAKIGALNPDDVGDAINHILPMIKYTDKGEAVVSYKDAAGKEVEQSLAEFAEKTYPTTSHAKRFIPADGNRGAGLLQKPGAINGAKAGGNPWGKDSFNLTRQVELIRTNKAEATRLAAEAGVSIE
jgi:hypothetical protein